MKSLGGILISFVLFGILAPMGVDAWRQSQREPVLCTWCEGTYQMHMGEMANLRAIAIMESQLTKSQLWDLTDAYGQKWRFHDREALIEWVKAKNAELPKDCFAKETLTPNG